MNIIYSQDESLKIESEESVEWTIDGETSEFCKEVKISNINKNIEFLIM